VSIVDLISSSGFKTAFSLIEALGFAVFPSCVAGFFPRSARIFPVGITHIFRK
jgi:hypothetical protein